MGIVVSCRFGLVVTFAILASTTGIGASSAVAQPASLSLGGVSVGNTAEASIFFSLQPGDEAYDFDGFSGSVENGNYGGSRNAQTSLNGASTSSQANLTVSTAASPSEVVITVQGSGSATGNRGEHFFGGQRQLSGFGSNSVSGSVQSCAPIQVQMTGNITLNGPGSASAGSGAEGQSILVPEPDGSDSIAVNVQRTVFPPEGGIATAGFAVAFASSARFENETLEDFLEGPGSISSSVTANVTITISLLSSTCNGNGGEDPEIFFWEGLNGAFNEASNWEPEGVPGEDDLAIFDKEQNYTVTLGNEASGRAIVERGFVSFEDGSYHLGNGSQENPSLIVGNDSEDSANLFLGTELSTTFATLGRGANTQGWVRVGPTEFPNLIAGGPWENQGRLTIGESGNGLVTVEGPGLPNQPSPVLLSSDEVVLGSLESGEGELHVTAGGNLSNPSVQVGNMAVGLHGLGQVTADTSAMASGEAIFGVDTGSAGFGFVKDATWRANRFVVGLRGTGTVQATDGGILIASEGVENILGDEAGSAGSLTLEGAAGLAILPMLTVGKAGIGFVALDIDTSLLTNHLRLGQVGNAEGNIQVLTGGILSVTAEPGALLIGNGSNGSSKVELEPGSQGFAVGVLIGLPGAGGTNFLAVDGADFTIEEILAIGSQLPLVSGQPTGALVLSLNGTVTTGDLIVNGGGEISGSGEIVLTAGNAALVEGTIQPGVVVRTSEELKQEGPSYGRGRGFDTLTIKGDVMGDGSVIVMSVGGEQDGLQDRLIVEGNASFEDVTIKLEFKYGYAPQAGDTIPLIEVMGDGSVMPASLEFLGLEPGFDFDIEIPGDGSVIQMRALSDGVPTSFAAEDLNEDGEVNAVDVQLVINGALGLLDPLETDVNFDKETNAVDVQLVINAALGL